MKMIKYRKFYWLGGYGSKLRIFDPGRFLSVGLAVNFKAALKNGFFSTPVTWSPQAMVFSIPILVPSGWKKVFVSWMRLGSWIMMDCKDFLKEYSDIAPCDISAVSAWQNFDQNNTSCQGFYKLYMIRMICINEWFPLTDSPFRRHCNQGSAITENLGVLNIHPKKWPKW